jgi:hypothetical protein
MAIRKRGASWQAQVRRDDYPALSKTFASKAEAVAWARDTERAADRAELPITIRQLKGVSLADLLKRYEETVTPTKRGAGSEHYRLKTLRAHPILLLGEALWQSQRLNVIYLLYLRSSVKSIAFHF